MDLWLQLWLQEAVQEFPLNSLEKTITKINIVIWFRGKISIMHFTLYFIILHYFVVYFCVLDEA